MHYEMLKHTGALPVVGVNTFRNPAAEEAGSLQTQTCIPLSRATEEEKESQLRRLAEFQKRNAQEAPAALLHLLELAQLAVPQEMDVAGVVADVIPWGRAVGPTGFPAGGSRWSRSRVRSASVSSNAQSPSSLPSRTSKKLRYRATAC